MRPGFDLGRHVRYFSRLKLSAVSLLTVVKTEQGENLIEDRAGGKRPNMKRQRGNLLGLKSEKATTFIIVELEIWMQ